MREPAREKMYADSAGRTSGRTELRRSALTLTLTAPPRCLC